MPKSSNLRYSIFNAFVDTLCEENDFKKGSQTFESDKISRENNAEGLWHLPINKANAPIDGINESSLSINKTKTKWLIANIFHWSRDFDRNFEPIDSG